MSLAATPLDARRQAARAFNALARYGWDKCAEVMRLTDNGWSSRQVGTALGLTTRQVAAALEAARLAMRPNQVRAP